MKKLITTYGTLGDVQPYVALGKGLLQAGHQVILGTSERFRAVYVGFGSMAGRNPQQLARTVIEALQGAEVRGIVATGWGGLNLGALPNSILEIENVPHDWLFPRVSAVVHHGGACTKPIPRKKLTAN